ncbi:porin [Caldimonas thermodepolymerans]|uniref:Porin n=1 Tax=Caldimonas thermodepolymerans TaxID=215580 RepID=A0AA46DCT7_9BURK|nr:porin [Caldimonas thermodepolymerans]TCP05907.1 putative porin [Caldimonas thermodepolymerans]UZG48156.1 porin [Caldimonas thermodepolymerans]
MKFCHTVVARAAAACLALGAFGAHAQSSVQLYGLIDMSVGSFQNSGADRLTRAESGRMTTSFFAFKGTEDLGGGLKAMFNLEAFLAADTGAAIGRTFWDRQANVGLGGSFGNVFLGHNTTSMFVQGLMFNPFSSSMTFSPTMRFLYSTAAPYAVSAGGTAWTNSILYTTPNFNGLSGTLQASMKEAAGGSNSYAASVLYAAGPLAAGLVYEKEAIGAADQTNLLVSGSYDFEVAKLYAQYGQTKDDAADEKYKMVQVGATVPLAGGSVLASYGQQNADEADVKVKTFSLGYDYFLSKRTDLYAVYMYDKAIGLDKGNTFAVGVRHRF